VERATRDFHGKGSGTGGAADPWKPATWKPIQKASHRARVPALLWVSWSGCRVRGPTGATRDFHPRAYPVPDFCKKGD